MRITLLFVGLVFIPLLLTGHPLDKAKLSVFKNERGILSVKFNDAEIPNTQIETQIQQSKSEKVPTFGKTLILGVGHIGALPEEWVTEEGQAQWPEGLDHILLVVLLALSGGGLWKILKRVTGFTLGHSLSLAAATLGWIAIPSNIVEVFIALSIAALAAFIAAGKKDIRGGFSIITLTGFLHGLGFANALKELNLPNDKIISALISFNLGVELGQIIILCVLIPTLWMLTRIRFAKAFTAPATAAVVMILASFWTYERTQELEIFRTEHWSAYRFPIIPPLQGEQVISRYEAEYKRDPANTLAINSLAQVLFSAYKKTGSLKDFERARSLNTASLQQQKLLNSSAKCLRASLLEAEHRFSEAILETQTLIQGSKQERECGLVTQISAALAIGDLNQAAIAANTLVMMKPYASYYLMRANILEAQGRQQESDFDLEKAFAREEAGETGFSQKLRFITARIYYQRGEIDEALQVTNSGLQIAENENLLILKADILNAKKDYIGAQDILYRAFELRPQSGILRRLAALNHQSDEIYRHYLEQAELLARAEVETSTGHRMELVRVLSMKGQSSNKLTEAIELIKKELDVRKSAEVMTVFSEVLLQKGNSVQAFHAIQTALQMGGRSKEVLQQAAKVEIALGNKSRAFLYVSERVTN